MFHIRYRDFKGHALYKKFLVVDEWNRYGRGSTHNHGIYWIDNAPDLDLTTLQTIRGNKKPRGVPILDITDQM